MTRFVGIFVLLALPASAGGQAFDIRNTEIPDFKTHFKFPEFKTKKEWDTHRLRLRKQILAAAGLVPLPAKTPLRPRVVRKLEYPGYSIETVTIEPLPGFFLGGNVYRPSGKGPFPGVLVPHGHWKRGRLEDIPVYSVPALCINLARQGYIAFAYDMVGYNDTRQTAHSAPSREYELWSFHPMGLQLWNSIRAIDYLQSLPMVDGSRIAVTGASGGGSQTIFLTAVDDRVKMSAPVNMVSAYMQGGDPCEEAPMLRLNTSNVEIAAMAAPRPMMLISCTQDWTRHTPVEEFPSIRHVYELYGHISDVENIHFDAEHNYNRQSREAVYRFLASHWKPTLTAEQLTDQDITLPPDDEMLAFAKGDLPAGTSNGDEVFQSWRVIARLQTEMGTSTADLKEALRDVLGADADPTIESGALAGQVTISRIGRHDRVNAYWTPGRGTPVLLVDPAGAESALKSALAREILASGRPLLVVDPFRPTRTREDRERFDKYFLSYNRSDDAEKVQDILTALAFLRSRSKAKAEIIGLGKAGIYALFAAAVAPVETSVIADLHGFSGSDEDFRDHFFVPGIQRAGGLNTALKLVKNLRAAIPASRDGAPAMAVDE